MKRVFAKVTILLMVAMLALSSCRGPKPCWGVTSDVREQQTEEVKG